MSGTTTLDVCGSRKIGDPTDDAIREALAGLDKSNDDAFVILGFDELTYVQTSGDVRQGFDLEYQDGSTDRHFRATREDLTLEEIVAVFVNYRDARDDWWADLEFEPLMW